MLAIAGFAKHLSQENNSAGRKEQMREDDLNPVVQFLIKKREELKLTPAQFARQYHVNPDIYESWEFGAELPDIQSCFGLLDMLGTEGREHFQLFLGPILDSIRGLPFSERGQAFLALDIILKNATPSRRLKLINVLCDEAARYEGLRKRQPASTSQNIQPKKTARRRRSRKGDR